MDTFELLPVLAAGDLSQTSAPELVAAIFRSRASGTLSLEGGAREEIRLFFKLGESCGASREAGFRSLGQILLSQGTLTAEQMEHASASPSNSGKKLGEVLTAAGLLTREQLVAALTTQHRENLRLLMLRNVGGYEWRGWEPPPIWATEVTVDPTRGILESLALPQLAGRRQAVLRWLGGAPGVRASMEFGELAARAELLLQDRRAAELFERPITTEAFLRDAGLPLPRAEALLVTLLLLGGVEPVPPPSALPLDPTAFEPTPPPPPPEAQLEEASIVPEAAYAKAQPEESLPEATIYDEPLPPPAPPDLGAELAAELAGLPPQARGAQPPAPPPADPGELFGPPGSMLVEADPLQMASELSGALDSPDLVLDESETELEPIAAAPELVAPEQDEAVNLEEQPAAAAPEHMELTGSGFAPLPTGDLFRTPLQQRSGAQALFGEAGDESSGLELQGGPPEPVDPAEEESRARRKRMVSTGLRNLGMRERPPPPEAEVQGGVAEEAVRELRSELAPQPLSSEDSAFLDEMHMRAKAAPRLDAYARLGISRLATQDQIRSAYLSLVKRFHPDRAQSPQLAAALPALEMLFGALREAYEAVGSPDARAAYDASGRAFAAGGKKPATRADEALLSLKKGEVLLKKRDYEAALRELRRSVDLNPTPEGLTALAWGLANDRSQGPSAREEALKLTARALKLDKDTARAHYVAGVLKRTTDPDEAYDHFRAAVALDARNNDAALELRLLERRLNKKPVTGPLSRLFKRDGK